MKYHLVISIKIKFNTPKPNSKSQSKRFKGTVFSKFWKKGSHMERHQAGADLTDLLKQAPHGEDNILPMPVVGKLLASSEKRGKPPEIRVFYFFAYMNLVIVFMIIFIIALWRWW